MLTNSITHVLESLLQYMALIIALWLFYHQTKNVSFSQRVWKPDHHLIAGHGTCFPIHNKPLILYQWIKSYRQQLGLTQERMAEILEVDVRTLQRWESGKTRPQPHHYSHIDYIRSEKFITFIIGQHSDRLLLGSSMEKGLPLGDLRQFQELTGQCQLEGPRQFPISPKPQKHGSDFVMGQFRRPPTFSRPVWIAVIILLMVTLIPFISLVLSWLHIIR